MDLDGEWWSQDIKEQLSIGNKLYFTTGDISLASYDNTFVMAFNKQLAEDYKVGNLYDAVRDGSWTFDKFEEIMKLTTHDLDQNGTFTLDDSFGIYSYTGLYTEMLTAAGLKMAEKDKDDYPIFAAESKKFNDVFERAISMLNTGNVFCNVLVAPYTAGKGNIALFQEGRAMFLGDVLYWVSALTGMDSNFGILPNPKYNAEQEKYYSSVNITATVLAVPVTSDNLDRTSVILEALARYSCKYTAKEYYDTAITVRNVRDEESREMLELIFSNRIMDLGMIYNWNGIYTNIQNYMQKGRNNLSSLITQSLSGINIGIENVINVYMSLD